MAVKNIGAGIKLDGEKEYKQAVTSINNNLKVMASEMKLVTAQFSANAQSVSALTAKNDVLNRQYKEQEDKISKLRDALKSASDTYGDADKRTLKWQESLNNASAELFNLKDQLDANSKALSKAKDNMEKYGLKEDEVAQQTKGVGSVLGDIAQKLGINLPAGAEKAIKALDNTKLSTAALVTAVTGLVIGFGKIAMESAKAADEIQELATKTGLSTDKIQEMNYASERLDVDTETMTGSMAKMIRTMDSAQKGTGDAANAFRKLHLNIKDAHGQLKDSETMFFEVVDALGRVRNETERDALAMTIFGKSAQELNPLIEAGSQQLKSLGDEAKKMGYILDSSSLESLNKLKDSMDKFSAQTTTFKNAIALAMLPVLSGLFEILNKIDPKVIAVVAIIGTMAAVAITVVKSIKSVTDIFSTFNVGAIKTTAIVIGVVAALIALAAIIAVIMGKGNELDKTMGQIGNSVGRMNGTINTAQASYTQSQTRYTFNGGGSSFASGLDYVPYDNFPARLHAGERVQRADENPYNPASTRGSGGDTIILNVKMNEVDEVYKLINTVKKAKQTRRAGKVRFA